MKTIWVDADACSRETRRILFRLAAKSVATIVLVANRPLRIQNSCHVESILVGPEEGAADRYILQAVKDGHIVITRDLDLVQQLLEKTPLVISDRGRVFSRSQQSELLLFKQLAEQRRQWHPAAKKRSRKKQSFTQIFARELEKMLYQ